MSDHFSSTAELAAHLAEHGFGPTGPDLDPAPGPAPLGPELERLP